MIDTELREVQFQIETATLVGRARFEAEMRAVDILLARAAGLDGAPATALLEAAKEILGEPQ